MPSTIIGTEGSRGSFSATAMPTAVWGSTQRPVSRNTVRMHAETSCSSARAALNDARISASARLEMVKLPDCASEAIMARTALPSRPLASNSTRSKFEDT